jgi:outer membrane immunogenic protein
MKKIVTAAAFAAAFVAAPAFAQDAAPSPVAGPRVEATVGWDNIVLSALDESGSKSGVTFGGEIGYDIQFGRGAVIGAYAGIDGATTKECLTDGTERGCIKAGRNITVGARIGAPIGSRALIYGKGGYSNGQLRVNYTDSAFPADNFSESGDADGFHVGGGIELNLSRGIYAKAEYNYTNYSVDDAGLGLDLERHRVVGGIGIRF